VGMLNALEAAVQVVLFNIQSSRSGIAHFYPARAILLKSGTGEQGLAKCK
jgi:hypothetical protein